MPFSLEKLKASSRPTIRLDFGANVAESLLEPFSLRGVYPPFDKEIAPEKFVSVKEIQPHQLRFHQGVPPSERENGTNHKAKYLLFSGGVGCIGGETILSGRRVDEWVADHTAPASIATLFGEAVPEVPYLKGQDDLYRVRTQSGREVVVTAQHRFLSTTGWRPLADLRVGDVIASDGSLHDDLEREKSTSSSDDCSLRSRQGDGLPTPVQVAVRDRLQQLHRTAFDNSAWVPYNLLCTESSYLRSNRDRQVCDERYQRVAGAYEAFRDRRQTPCQVEPYSLPLDSGPLSLAWERLFLEWSPLFQRECLLSEELGLRWTGSYLNDGRPRVDFGFAQTKQQPDRGRRYVFGDCHAWQDRWEHAACEAAHGCDTVSLRSASPSLFESESDRKFLALLQGLVSFCPYDNDTSFWDRIQSIVWERFDNFYDIGVPGPEHYSAHGIWHHNSGKTLAACAEMFRLLRTYPGIKIVCCSAYDFYFDEFLMPVWNLVCNVDSGDRNPHVRRYLTKSRTLLMTNGSTLRFKAYDDHNKIKGWEAHVIWVEEASELGDGNNDKALLIWQALQMRLRATRPKYPLCMYVTQNPKGHNWVWKVFIKHVPGVEIQPLGDVGNRIVTHINEQGEEVYFKEWEKKLLNGDILYTIAVPSMANKHLAAGYIASILGQTMDNKGVQQRMVMGEFNPINTLVYESPTYDETVHCIQWRDFCDYWEVDRIPEWWRVVVGIDVGGSRSPWAVEGYVQTDDGHWIAFEEIYEVNSDWGDICDKIHEKFDKYTNIQYWIDPISSKQEQGPRAETVEREFRARGIHTNQPKGYNKQGAILRVYSFLERNYAIPCIYRADDVQTSDSAGNVHWEIGHANLYYLAGCPWKVGVNDFGKEVNTEGYATPANIAEKRVYRWDSTKLRQAKESEEGLSPMISQKLIDRDDHAQTAEFFAFLGIAPLDTPKTREKSRRQEIKEPSILYGGYGRKHRRLF